MWTLSPVEERRRAKVRGEVDESGRTLAEAYLEAAGGDYDIALLKMAKVASLLLAEVELYRADKMTPQMKRAFQDQFAQVSGARRAAR